MGPKNSGVATAWSGVAMATLDPPQMAPLLRRDVLRPPGVRLRRPFGKPPPWAAVKERNKSWGTYGGPILGEP